MRILGTRTRGIDSTTTWLDELPDDAHGAVLVAAYWDTRAASLADSLSRRLDDGPVQLLLWVDGATSLDAWTRLGDVRAQVDVRLVNSPAAGIFHVKASGIVAGDGSWLRAYVGSANLTDAGYLRNVELGVVADAGELDLQPLRQWFDEQWSAATPYSQQLLEQVRTTVQFDPEDAPPARRRRSVGTDVVAAAPAPPVQVEPAPAGTQPATAATAAPRGLPTWHKRMSASDAAQYSENANPQSMITLTRVKGVIDDPDAFFRHTFFADGWRADPGKDGRLTITVSMDVVILGTDHGARQVTFTWDAARRDRQHGPATHLHLQPNLEALFQQQVLTGCYVTLRAVDGAYRLEVTREQPGS